MTDRDFMPEYDINEIGPWTHKEAQLLGALHKARGQMVPLSKLYDVVTRLSLKVYASKMNRKLRFHRIVNTHGKGYSLKGPSNGTA